MTAPAPTTLRITDERQGKMEVPMMKSRAFQLITDVTSGISGIISIHFISSFVEELGELVCRLAE